MHPVSNPRIAEIQGRHYQPIKQLRKAINDNFKKITTIQHDNVALYGEIREKDLVIATSQRH